MICPLFWLVYSICNITNICSEKKICRMAQNIMSRWGSAGFRFSTARAAVLTTKCWRRSWVRRPSRAAVATGLRCQSGCRWRAHHSALLKPSISASQAYLKDEGMKGGQRDLRLGIGKRAFSFEKIHMCFTCFTPLTFFELSLVDVVVQLVRHLWKMAEECQQICGEVWGASNCGGSAHLRSTAIFGFSHRFSDLNMLQTYFITRWAPTRYGTNFTTYKQPENKLGFPWIQITPSFF